jgi:hypothetical protein
MDLREYFRQKEKGNKEEEWNLIPGNCVPYSFFFFFLLTKKGQPVREISIRHDFRTTIAQGFCQRLQSPLNRIGL